MAIPWRHNLWHFEHGFGQSVALSEKIVVGNRGSP
jgi:hypothetical protein